MFLIFYFYSGSFSVCNLVLVSFCMFIVAIKVVTKNLVWILLDCLQLYHVFINHLVHKKPGIRDPPIREPPGKEESHNQTTANEGILFLFSTCYLP